MKSNTTVPTLGVAERAGGPGRWVAGSVLMGLGLYVLTCAPGVLWQDSSIFQLRVYYGDLRGTLGLPLAHPLYIMLAKVFSLLPFGEYAYRVNLFSGVCGAASLGFCTLLLLELTGSRVAAVSATCMLGLSHTFWMHSVMAEVYSLYALGLLIELWLLNRFFARRRPRWLILAMLVCGVNLSNHMFALLHLPAYAGVCVWALRSRVVSMKHVIASVGLFAIGTLPYTWLSLADFWNGQPLLKTLRLALVGPPHFESLVLGTSFRLDQQASRTLGYFCLNFPTPLALLAPIGIWRAWNDRRMRGFAAIGIAILVIAFVFAFRYDVPDQYVFFTPCYILFAVFAGLAIPRIAAASRKKATLCIALSLLSLPAYEIAPFAMQRFGISIGGARDLPFRDTYRYFIRPRKNGENGTERFAEYALKRAAPDGLLTADVTIKYALAYVRDIQGRHRGVTLVDSPYAPVREPTVPYTREGIAEFVAKGTAYICDNTPGAIPKWILEGFDLVPTDKIFRLEPKTDRALEEPIPKT
ncbi:MAG: DUF2723 domain-containing protein [Planctomycetota bacterium]|nr:DUF2723 domain-containing protein [Planctomycetota bacterium]